ncbi:MAG: metal ABC transporter ATP-binding protein [Candidatus Aenigmarchaeota archaeon]|nr:metal ABC transporter ATP-binding protein [Candidatus Aenigmarchaeota archaeon]
MTDTILKVKKLSVNFGRDIILKNLSFEVKRGEILTIIGPNGAGKTTLLRALLNIISYEGEVVWKDGIKVNYLPQRLSKEKFSLLPISVREFFKFKKPSEDDVLKMLKEVGLEKRVLDKNPAELSSGQFQRMLIAWSLIDNPDVLLLDEPTTGIDVSGEETIYSLLNRFWKERNLTILMVTHDLNVVYAYSTNCLCTCKERVCYGPPKKVLTPQALQRIYKTEIKFYKHTHR